LQALKAAISRYAKTPQPIYSQPVTGWNHLCFKQAGLLRHESWWCGEPAAVGHTGWPPVPKRL